MEVHINNIDNDLYITFDSAMNILDEIQRLRKENKELVKYKDICFRYEKLLDKEYEKLITYNLDNINNLENKGE